MTNARFAQIDARKYEPMGRYLSIFAAIFVFLALMVNAQAATTLLPNGMQCFQDANGPLSSGSLNMYFPATTTPKTTWQTSTQSSANTQPIQLDANGCAVIYGVGTYRQMVFDGPVVSGAVSGNQVYDQLTTDTSAYNSVFWAGIAGNTPNIITIVDTGFNATDGSVIQFTALSTNTGATTLNPSGFGAISIVKDTTAGPVSLSGGEIIAGNIISVVYSSSGNNFHLLNTVIASASGATAPLCGAANLRIINDAGTPNSIINLTADQIVMQNSSGLTINRSNVSLTAINISTGTVTSTANGMDGEAPGTDTWVDIFAIDNGAATAGLVSLASGNGKSPNMPSGYTYKCYMGSMRVDSAGTLRRTLQRGSRTQYVVTAASNTLACPVGDSGAKGNPAIPTWIAVATGSFIPPTATEVRVIASNTSGTGTVIVAPNNAYGASPAANVYFSANTGNASNAAVIDMVLESTNFYWASTAAQHEVIICGWKDAVNAN